MTAMLIGTALAVAALAFVLYPLFRETLTEAPPAPPPLAADRPNSAVDALREIEFDHVTGKLSARDYADLKALYTQRAVESMRNAAQQVPVLGGIICSVCGPRPEPDARFCSRCGRSLAA